MKKALILFLSLAMILAITACSKANDKSLSELPDDYSLENAIADGCVVFKNSDITSGESIWDAFMKSVNDGKNATVRLANHIALDDPSRYAPELYEEIKDDYPLLFVQDLTFNGETYVIDGLEDEDGQLFSKTYKYLMKYEGEPKSENALYYSYLYYVLVNDDTVTWEDIEWGMFSSVFGARIDHFRVYTDLAYKSSLTISPS